jgi:chemotaxis protein histidine kinase CheA
MEEVQMGFLAFTWGKKKRLRYSKQETQQHIFNKKAHVRNIKKGDPKYEAICPLCLHNDENQAHILLRCCYPAMEYWREEYFERCKATIKEQKDPILEKYLGGLWEWIATPLDEDDQTIIDMDSRRVAVMMGRPIKEDLERPGSQTHLSADQIQRMQTAMLELWKTSLELAVTTWRTRGKLRSTPDKVNEWYKRGPITEDVMRGMFEHVYRARKEPQAEKKHIEDHGFNIENESAQRPRDQITEDPAVKRRKLTESKEVIKARKARKLQEKAEEKEKEEKRLAIEKKKQAVENAKKAKAAATAAKARERKKRRAKPPLAKRAREEGKQGVQVPEGPRTKQARTGAEKDSDQPNNHVHRTTRNSNKEREESQGVTFSNITVVSNINKGICAKGDG